MTVLKKIAIVFIVIILGLTACGKTSKTTKPTETTTKVAATTKGQLTVEEAKEKALKKCEADCSRQDSRMYSFSEGSTKYNGILNGAYHFQIYGTFYTKDDYGDDHKWKYQWEGYVYMNQGDAHGVIVATEKVF